MSETTGTARGNEAYSFACMRCGHAWEQSYEIEHHVDPGGKNFVVYRTDGKRVPSPLSNPDCPNCGGHVVRIMRPGRVSSVMNVMMPPEVGGPVPGEPDLSAPSPDEPVRSVGEPSKPGAQPLTGSTTARPEAAPAEDRGSEPGRAADTEPGGEGHHWQVSDLLHPFKHRK